VNGMIADILQKNEGQMKCSLELLKKSLSEVLKKFKHELDAKFQRQLREELAKQQSFSEQASEKAKTIEQFEALMEEHTPVK